MKKLHRYQDVVFFLVTHEDEQLWRRFLQLRHKEYCEKKRWEPKHPEGIETDGYDCNSVFIIAMRNGKLISGCRLIDGRKTRLPIEEAELNEPIEKNSVEISRLINHYFTGIWNVMLELGLIMAVAKYVKNNKYDRVYMLMRKGFLRRIRCHLFRVIGPPKHLRFAEFVPAMIVVNN